jgi:hypothetical protein
VDRHSIGSGGKSESANSEQDKEKPREFHVSPGTQNYTDLINFAGTQSSIAELEIVREGKLSISCSCWHIEKYFKAIFLMAASIVQHQHAKVCTIIPAKAISRTSKPNKRAPRCIAPWRPFVDQLLFWF